MIGCIVHGTLLFSATFMLANCTLHLIRFLSSHGTLGSGSVKYPSLMTKSLRDWTELERQYILVQLFKDLLLVGLFVVQHSLMATSRWKQVLLRCNIYISERLLYIMATSLTLNIMISQWISTPDVMLWNINLDVRKLHWLFYVLHAIAWLILFSEIMIMDPFELIGIKQVFYYYKGKAPPIHLMPKPLQIFYHHMRHAGTTSLWILLWVHPIMTLDRFLLAFTWSAYLVFGHNLSHADFKFVQYYYGVNIKY